ncbi:hypothetical protein [Pseudomonas aeruginosa]|uniref:hypothetical protein n=1 Tax=Pseudomonas aeruginosa TaxID=287 RepID=UPI002F908D48
MSDNLKTESETFQAHLPQLLVSSEGKYALIVGSELIGTYDTYSDAVQEGYKIAGLEARFLVRKISRVGDSAHFSRPLYPSMRAVHA